jgi:hypothetical protein
MQHQLHAETDPTGHVTLSKIKIMIVWYLTRSPKPEPTKTTAHNS